MIDRSKIKQAMHDAAILAFQRRMTVNLMIEAIVQAAVDTLIDEVEKHYGPHEDESKDANEGTAKDGGSKDAISPRKRANPRI